MSSFLGVARAETMMCEVTATMTILVGVENLERGRFGVGPEFYGRLRRG